MRKKWCLPFLLAVLVMIFACGCSGGQTDSETSGINLSSFESTDFEGNQINGKVFEKADLTVLNIWATYCNICIEEMPVWEELAQEYEGKGVQIIGLPADANSEEAVAAAKEIAKKTGVSYPQMMPSDSLINLYLNQVTAVPETVFVDGKGQVIKSIAGAQGKEEWKAMIDELCEQERGDDQ